jgi:nitroreductase
VIRSLFEAARWAPSSFNEQPWSFLVAGHDDAEEFSRLLSCLVEPNQVWAQRAGLLILSVARATFTRTGKPNRSATHDVGLAAASLTFEATSRGLFVHQMAGILIDRARELYAIPAGFDAHTAIAVGHLGQQAELAPRTRKAQAEFVFRGRFGDAASF